LENIRYALQTVHGDNEKPKSIITINDVASRSPISGCIIDKVFPMQDGWIVITNDDCPFEESLNITYLNSKLEILDEVTIGWMYATGSLKNFEIVGADTFQFNFFANENWFVKVNKTPITHIPLISDGREVTRPWKFKKHLIVNRS
jgi:hypothetical protein